MKDARLVLVLALLTPLAALALFQGMVTAGLAPLAIFGPLYAVGRATTRSGDGARIEGARAVAGASVGIALALATTLVLFASGASTLPIGLRSLGLFLLAAGIGTLAGLATAPPERPLTVEETRRWVFVEALQEGQARGLALLFITTLLAALLVAMTREALLFTGPDGAGRTLPQALLPQAAHGGYLVLPSRDAPVALAVPLTLAPLALGLLLPIRRAFPVALGGLALLVLVPVALFLDLPVDTPGGAIVPLSLRPAPSLDAARALAPAGAGALLGVGLVTALRRTRKTGFEQRVGWALVGVLAALLTHGLVPAAGLLLGGLAAGIALTWRTLQAPVGAALALGVLAGTLLGPVVPGSTALGVGALTGIVAGSAVASSATTRQLTLPNASLRSIRTVLYFLPAAGIAGGLAYLGSQAIAADAVPFEAPHAQALASGLIAVVTGRSAALLVWGLAAGALLQLVTRHGALVAIGLLAGPTTGLLVLAGAGIRTWWENRLLDRARTGHVMRGELGYGMLRVHMVVAGILVGEALVLALAGVVVLLA